MHPARQIDKQLEQNLVSGVNLGARILHTDTASRVRWRRCISREVVNPLTAGVVRGVYIYDGDDPYFRSSSVPSIRVAVVFLWR